MQEISTSENNQIRLKKATISDIPTLIELEKSVAGVKTTGIVPSGVDEWTRDIKNNVVYLIQQDDVVVGDVQYEKKGESHIQITGLVVDPKFQGQGIGRKALMLVLEELKDVKRIDLTVHPENEKALKLYQSLGFVVESQKATADGGVPQDAVKNYYGGPRLILVLQKI